MSLFSVLTDIVEAIADTNNGVKKNVVPTRPVPAERLKELLKQGKEKEAILLLRNAMNWDNNRATVFIQSLKTGEATAKYKAPIARSKNSTQIEAILHEQKLAEINAGGTLLDYIRSKFKI